MLLLLALNILVCLHHIYAHAGYVANANTNLFKCDRDFCNRITCEDISDCPEGRLVPKRSYCGCCDACVKSSGKGEPCQDIRENLEDVLTSECKQGLKCLDGICVVDELANSCLLAREFMEEQKLKGLYPYAKDLWLPECNKDGSYRAKQEKKRKNICVDEMGNRIHGQEEQDLSRKSACGCSRHMQSHELNNMEDFMTKAQEHCTDTGDYSDLQCIRNICYCADNTTGEAIGRLTKKAYIHLLPCYTEVANDNHYLKQCENQLIRSRSLRQQFHQKHISIVGLEFVSCDYDGTFSFKQCDSSRCVCTDNAGVGIKSYHPDKTREIELLMKCNCARDEHNREAFHSRYPRMNCDVKGNFQQLQCFGEENCYCVDEDGDVISEQRKNLTEDYCKEMLQSLSFGNINPEKLSTVITEATTDDYDYSDESDYS